MGSKMDTPKTKESKAAKGSSKKSTPAKGKGHNIDGEFDSGDGDIDFLTIMLSPRRC
jgi:hypothetical protein